MTVESPDRDVIPVQMLRAIAATMVVFVHMDLQLERLHYQKLGTDWLASGVDIFFVISGFIMWTSVERRGDLSASEFFKNRLIRIVPLYWFTTTIVVLIAVLLPHILNTTVLRPWHAFASYLFIPVRHPTTGMFWPLLIPGWSLNYEMLFYLVFAIAIGFSSRSPMKRLLLIGVMLTVIVLAAGVLRREVDVANFYANPVMLEFLAGVLLGVIWRKLEVPRSWLWLVMALAGFVCLWFGAARGAGFIFTAVGATMIVAGAIFVPRIPANPVSALGDASYSLYLTHIMSLAVVAMVWRHAFASLDWSLFVISGLTASILAAFAVYRGFEAPMTAALKKRLPRRRASASSEPSVTPAAVAERRS